MLTGQSLLPSMPLPTAEPGVFGVHSGARPADQDIGSTWGSTLPCIGPPSCGTALMLRTDFPHV